MRELPDSIFVRGVNLSGAEFGRNIPGRFSFDYAWPTDAEIAKYVERGVAVIRLPFRWERIQPQLERPLDQNEKSRMDAAVTSATRRGIIVILDLHNYASFRMGNRSHPIGSAEVPASALADFWTRIASDYRDNQMVWFGLMNEPHSMPADRWRDIAQAAIEAIRGTGASNKVLVPGTSWTGAHSWVSSGNAAAMESFSDPANNFAFEVHQYLDRDSSGTTASCTRGAGTGRLLAFERWLTSLPYRAQGFLAEFAGGTSDLPDADSCRAELTALLEEIERNRSLWAGWTVWGGGLWWSPNYPFRLDPASRQGSENALMRFYNAYWAKSQPPYERN